jgi:hypothetical protein
VKSPLVSSASATERGQSDIRRNDIDTGVLHGVPSLLSDLLGGLVKLLGGGLTVPVRLDDLIEASATIPIQKTWARFFRNLDRFQSD